MKPRRLLLFALTVPLLAACKSKSASTDDAGAAVKPQGDPELAAIAGQWQGAGWGFVVFRADGTGSYTDTYKTGPGEMTLTANGSGKYGGKWGESKQRHGTLELELSADKNQLSGTWEPAPDCTIGSPTGGKLVFLRANPSAQ